MSHALRADIWTADLTCRNDMRTCGVGRPRWSAEAAFRPKPEAEMLRHTWRQGVPMGAWLSFELSSRQLIDMLIEPLLQLFTFLRHPQLLKSASLPR